MIRVLIVDDSAFMRNAIASMLSSDPDIAVAGTAADGLDAVRKAALLRPDVVTMDIEMPRMDGITALKHIMSSNPVPVIMVSAFTAEGAGATLEALDLGAVDFIPKNLAELSVNIVKIREMLIGKVKEVGLRGSKAYVRPGTPLRRHDRRAGSLKDRGRLKAGIIVIGASTGGPRALQEIIPKLPADLPVPVVIAQHMPPNFTGPFAERLDRTSRMRVKEAEEGDILKPGVALLAAGRGNMKIINRDGERRVAIVEDTEDFNYRPSVDALMLSVAECYSGRTLSVILSGMGNDGLRGVSVLKKAGGKVIAQDEETCVVYGMPKAAVDAGMADKVLPVEEIADEILLSL